jgi:hypothetical protein
MVVFAHAKHAPQAAVFAAFDPSLFVVSGFFRTPFRPSLHAKALH